MVLSRIVKQGMDIEIGKLYTNRTLKYLVPALNFYGPTLKTKLNLVFKLAFGIHDSLLEGTHLQGQKNIFILVDKLVRPDLYQNFMDWLKHQEYYVTDYAYDSILEHNSRKQMIVIAFPPKLADIYDKFLLGKYSLMYTKEEINTFFGDENKAEARHVLCKTLFAKNQFKILVRETFGTILEEQDFLVGSWEYDFPPSAEEEFFNTWKPLGS
jgi:hypothetical protein